MVTGPELGDGLLRLRDIHGTCDLCGDDCYTSAEICTFAACSRCEGGVFHQHCVEKFLKKYGYDSTRKTGFPCPRGRGKGTRFPEDCKGMIGKSHPIIPKNEEKKKKSLPPPINEVLARQPKGKDAVKGAAKQQVKPPAVPCKVAPPKPHHVAATVLRSGAPMAHNTSPAAANVWLTCVNNNAILEPRDPAPAAAVPSELSQPRSAHVPVGLVLEEAISKAQKKNLARRRKKAHANAAGADTVSEAGTAATDVSSLDEFAAFTEQQKGSTSGSSSTAHQLLNGTNFVTDIKRYQQLLGMYMGDSDDEEDDSDSGRESELTKLSAFAEAELSVASSAMSTARPSSSGSTRLTAAAEYSERASASSTPENDEDAALHVAMQQSAREYALQQELQHQREILDGYRSSAAQLPADVPAVVASEAPALSFAEGPIGASPPVAPLHFNIPVVVPVVLTAAPPSVVAEAPPSTLGYGKFGYGNFGYQPAQPLWPQQQAYVAPNITATTAPAMHGAGYSVPPCGNMAARHDMPDASGADDDDLGSLLALCGVSG